MKVTIADVAKKAGVSKTTVSRILNGNYDHTKEETKERILKVIKELDYRPNALAKGLKATNTNVLGIVLSNLKNPFWTTVLEGVEETCRDLGYNLMICNSDEDPVKEKKLIQEFQMRQVDGIVINPTVRNMELYKELVESKYPLVVINRNIPNLKVNSVMIDNVKGAKLALNHLFENGAKKVAVFAINNPYVSTWKDRVSGYKEAILSKDSYSENDFRILQLESPLNNVKEATINFLKKFPDIDAIFSTNNMLSLEVMEALKLMKLNMPEDIKFVSYDEMVWAKLLAVPVTTISQPGYEMGKKATELLIRSIRNKNKEQQKSVETIILEPKLIGRRSSGA